MDLVLWWNEGPFDSKEGLRIPSRVQKDSFFGCRFCCHFPSRVVVVIEEE